MTISILALKGKLYEKILLLCFFFVGYIYRNFLLLLKTKHETKRLRKQLLVGGEHERKALNNCTRTNVLTTRKNGFASFVSSPIPIVYSEKTGFSVTS